jgi:hypothetical protein
LRIITELRLVDRNAFRLKTGKYEVKVRFSKWVVPERPVRDRSAG